MYTITADFGEGKTNIHAYAAVKKIALDELSVYISQTTKNSGLL